MGRREGRGGGGKGEGKGGGRGDLLQGLRGGIDAPELCCFFLTADGVAFVGRVAAVVDRVAHHRAVDARAVAAAKLVLAARPVCWKIHTHTHTGGSVAEWSACWTQAQNGPGSNRSRDAVG